MRINDIPKSRLSKLNRGVVETKNLTEWLAVDQSKLLRAVGAETELAALTALARKLPKLTVPKQISWIGMEISKLPKLEMLETHGSDVVRCWACVSLGARAANLKAAFQAVKRFAQDPHFGVREIAWMAVRERICEDPNQAIALLVSWARDKNEYIRRFSTEATRPRGVWAKHIGPLKRDPSPGRRLLDNLYKDESRYVQDSVANWLNDAAKDHPKWVVEITEEWSRKSSTSSTNYIVKRARRKVSLSHRA